MHMHRSFKMTAKMTRILSVSTSYHHHAREAPKWKLPPQITSSRAPRLAIWNSLTKMNTPFVPLDPDGRTVTWYCCGPTVYDAGHLGLARNYISTDVIRRIMRDYFGFDVMFVQHVILKTRYASGWISMVNLLI